MLAVLVSSCGSGNVRTYAIIGQIVAINPQTRQLTIAHHAIPGYMDAMTMPFRVEQRADITGLQPGDLVRARLIVTPDDGFLDNIEKTGHRALPETTSGADPFVLEGDRIPNVQLVDQTGTPRPLLEKRGSATVLTFVYTRCPFPTFCPRMDRNFVTLQRRIANDAGLAGRVYLVSLTIDPEYDSPSVLRRHAERLGADPAVWTFAIPRESVPGAFAAGFGVTQMREVSDPALIVHNLATVVVDPAGTVAKIFRSNDWTVQQVTDVLRSVVDVSATGGHR